MKQLVVTAAGLLLILSAAPSARAQVTLDVSKITCEQFTKYRITTPDNIAIWLNGYRSGKRDSTLLDTQALVAKSKKLVGYCRRNPETLVMQAAETVLGEQK